MKLHSDFTATMYAIPEHGDSASEEHLAWRQPDLVGSRDRRWCGGRAADNADATPTLMRAAEHPVGCQKSACPVSCSDYQHQP